MSKLQNMILHHKAKCKKQDSSWHFNCSKILNLRISSRLILHHKARCRKQDAFWQFICSKLHREISSRLILHHEARGTKQDASQLFSKVHPTLGGNISPGPSEYHKARCTLPYFIQAYFLHKARCISVL